MLAALNAWPCRNIDLVKTRFITVQGTREGTIHATLTAKKKKEIKIRY